MARSCSWSGLRWADRRAGAVDHRQSAACPGLAKPSGQRGHVSGVVAAAAQQPCSLCRSKVTALRSQPFTALLAALPGQVWRPDAVIEIKADVESPPLQLTPPGTRYFRGG